MTATYTTVQPTTLTVKVGFFEKRRLAPFLGSCSRFILASSPGLQNRHLHHRQYLHTTRHLHHHGLPNQELPASHLLHNQRVDAHEHLHILPKHELVHFRDALHHVDLLFDNALHDVDEQQPLREHDGDDRLRNLHRERDECLGFADRCPRRRLNFRGKRRLRNICRNYSE